MTKPYKWYQRPCWKCASFTLMANTRWCKGCKWQAGAVQELVEHLRKEGRWE